MPLFVVLNHSPSSPTQGLKQPPGMEFPNASGTSSLCVTVGHQISNGNSGQWQRGREINTPNSLIKITLKS